MASLKLLFKDEWRRLPEAPNSWSQLMQELRDMYGVQSPGFKVIGGGEELVRGEREYLALLQQALNTSTKVLKVEVVELPTENQLDPAFHLPQCSRCLGRLSGKEEIYALACGHIFCGLCYFQISNDDRSLCPHDGRQVKGVHRRDLQVKVQLLADQLTKVPFVQFQLPSELMQLHETVLSQVNVRNVQCSYFMKTGSCQDEQHCRYMHGPGQKDDKTTYFEALNMKDASSDAIQQESREVDTIPIATEESSTCSAPIPMHDQGSATPLQLDKASDGILFVDKAGATVPVEMRSEGISAAKVMVSVQQEAAVVMENKESGPGAPSNVSAQVEDQPDFYTSLRTSIRMALSESALTEHRVEEFPVTCSECGLNPIPEHYFKCARCTLQLCPACEERSEHHHPFFKIKHVRQMEGLEVPRISEDPLVLKLVSMGFKDKEAVQEALRATGGDFSRAVERLLAP